MENTTYIKRADTKNDNTEFFVEYIKSRDFFIKQVYNMREENLLSHNWAFTTYNPSTKRFYLSIWKDNAGANFGLKGGSIINLLDITMEQYDSFLLNNDGVPEIHKQDVIQKKDVEISLFYKDRKTVLKIMKDCGISNEKAYKIYNDDYADLDRHILQQEYYTQRIQKNFH